MSNTAIHTDSAPKALGPYSQALLAANTLYISGQLGIDPASGKWSKAGTASRPDRHGKYSGYS
jgi:2-iminobutanoate/2-iminopropanoate deaminase